MHLLKLCVSIWIPRLRMPHLKKKLFKIVFDFRYILDNLTLFKIASGLYASNFLRREKSNVKKSILDDVLNYFFLLKIKVEFKRLDSDPTYS